MYGIDCLPHLTPPNFCFRESPPSLLLLAPKFTVLPRGFGGVAFRSGPLSITLDRNFSASPMLKVNYENHIFLDGKPDRTFTMKTKIQKCLILAIILGTSSLIA